MRGAGGLLSAALLLTGQARAAEKTAQLPLGFSNLVLRVENSSGIAIAPDAYRVLILEHLRARGLDAVGAESIVFGQDDADRAERVLGGTIRRLECQEHERLNCRVSVHWQVLDVASNAVAYEMTSSFALYGVNRDRLDAAGRNLVLGALDRLVERPKFRAMLKTEPRDPSDKHYPPASFLGCNAAAAPLPAGSETAMDGTVVIENGEGFGSGFFVNTESLIVTAAHVVESGPLTIRDHDGNRFSAVVVRRNRKSDIALLRPTSARPSSCLPLGDQRALVGADAYVIGTPASRDFAFSVTRGIVSGARVINGAEFWQTDASINPGNSGGPMLTSAGRVFAVTSWKVTGGVEGIGFGVPIELGLKTLGLKPDAHTDAALWQSAPEVSADTSAPERVVDDDNPLPTLDPEAERERLRREQERREREAAEKKQAEAERREREQSAALDRLTPGWVKGLKYGGMGLLALSGAGALYTSSLYEPGRTAEPDFRELRLANDLCWVGMTLGAAATVTGFALTPRRLPAASSKRAQLLVLPQGVVLQGSFQ